MLLLIHTKITLCIMWSSTAFVHLPFSGMPCIAIFYMIVPPGLLTRTIFLMRFFSLFFLVVCCSFAVAHGQFSKQFDPSNHSSFSLVAPAPQQYGTMWMRWPQHCVRKKNYSYFNTLFLCYCYDKQKAAAEAKKHTTRWIIAVDPIYTIIIMIMMMGMCKI